VPSTKSTRARSFQVHCVSTPRQAGTFTSPGPNHSGVSVRAGVSVGRISTEGRAHPFGDGHLNIQCGKFLTDRFGRNPNRYH